MAGAIQNFTGIDQDYEQPESPELIVARGNQSAEEAAAQIMRLIAARGLIDHFDDLADDWSI
jgi:adenylylsulfate kinase-like enzyme